MVNDQSQNENKESVSAPKKAVIAFAIGGGIRGATAQVFGLLGVLTGLWAAVFVSGWVADHWLGARPAAVFTVLRFLVAGLSGLALAAVFQWWGDRLAKAVREGPLGWFDRGIGALVGAGLGGIVGALILLVALTIQRPSGPATAVAQSRTVEAEMRVAADACSLGVGVVPGSGWLKQRFLAAKRRAAHLREGGARAKSV